MTLDRILDLRQLLAKKSFFLFGARSTGKSTLIRQQLPDDCLYIDLLDGSMFLRLAADPGELERMVQARRRQGEVVVIDEIQKLPALLDQIHRMIERRPGSRFLMTGSSARKLRSGGTNLLAGRAWEAHLFPLVAREIPGFELERALRFGTLPQVYLSEDPEEELAAYTQTYLREEILAEGMIRKMPPFARFLRMAALSNARLINFASLASDAALPASTVREYFSILGDTLLGFTLEPWTGSEKRKAIQTGKFYFFDVGVTHALAGTEHIERNSDLFGRSFEHWVALELRAWIAYRRLRKPLRFWRSVNGQEVDFLVGEDFAVEVKATTRVSRRDLAGLKALGEEKVFRHLLCVSMDPVEQVQDGIRCLPWQTFLEHLWRDAFTS